MKVPLAIQIEHADRARDALQVLVDEGVQSTDGPSFLDRLHAAEGICLTLRFNQTYEADIREYIAGKSRNPK